MLMLIWNNITRRRTQSLLTVTITMLTVLVFVMVLGVFMTVNRGLTLSRERLGADAILIPKYASATGGDLLFTAIPENIYMDADVLEEAKELDGIAAMTPQFYAQTLALSCCEPGEEARIIGYDAATDFILTPYLPDEHKQGVTAEEMIVGHNFANADLVGYNYMVLGKLFKVVAMLEPTGTGMDSILFADLDQVRQMCLDSEVLASRALLHDPALILADEPTNDLDEHWSNEIIRILKEQTEKGTAVVMVTHNSRWATEATRRCRLEDGVLRDIAE